MKKLYFLFIFLGFITISYGQVPQAFKYQAVIRDTSGFVIADKLISLKISILIGTLSGEPVYTEIHDITTNSLGIINLEIGRGVTILGKFDEIPWGTDSFFIRLEFDQEGGMNYQYLGTSQLLAVPYALYAEKSGSDTLQSVWLYSENGIYYNKGNIGIGTPNPENSALLDLSSDNRGFLPPRLTKEEILEISNPVNGLMVFCTTDDKLYIYISNSLTWKEILYGNGGIAPPFPCGDTTVLVNHVAGDVAPITKTVSYGTVTNIPGEPTKCWITQNLGADYQASTVDDATEPAAGWYWQFNRKQGYAHDGTNRIPDLSWITIVEDSDWRSFNDPCQIELGNGWRIPTQSEWVNLDDYGTWIDWEGPWESGMKMHAGGLLNYQDGSLTERGVLGAFWSNTQGVENTAWYQGLSSVQCYPAGNQKSFGFSIRCVRE